MEGERRPPDAAGSLPTHAATNANAPAPNVPQRNGQWSRNSRARKIGATIMIRN